eukprot:83728_1
MIVLLNLIIALVLIQPSLSQDCAQKDESCKKGSDCCANFRCDYWGGKRRFCCVESSGGSCRSRRDCCGPDRICQYVGNSQNKKCMPTNSHAAMENDEIEDVGSLNAENKTNPWIESKGTIELTVIISGIVGIICIIVVVGLFWYFRRRNSKLKQFSQSELSDEEQSDIDDDVSKDEIIELKEGRNIST